MGREGDKKRKRLRKTVKSGKQTTTKREQRKYLIRKSIKNNQEIEVNEKEYCKEKLLSRMTKKLISVMHNLAAI